ncbi:pyridoxal 5'-phosphate synthase [Humibacter soli]
MIEWLFAAIEAGVPEPHAATLSTVDEDGKPDARVLIVKDITDDGAFEIATSVSSPKVLQLRANPRCALSFYWTPLARAIRIRGTAVRAGAAAAVADFTARHPDARAMVLAGEQGRVIDDVSEHERVLSDAKNMIAGDPESGASEWSVWRIEPESIEFWQGDPSRDHLRLRYDLGPTGWEHHRIAA